MGRIQIHPENIHHKSMSQLSVYLMSSTLKRCLHGSSLRRRDDFASAKGLLILLGHGWHLLFLVPQSSFFLYTLMGFTSGFCAPSPPINCVIHRQSSWKLGGLLLAHCSEGLLPSAPHVCCSAVTL